MLGARWRRPARVTTVAPGHSVAMFRDKFGLFLRWKPPKGAAIGQNAAL
jgi:hypothetical protein